jgi:replicative DNA helicase
VTVTELADARASRRRVPCDEQAERSLLGAMLLSRDAIVTAAERLTADDFYRPAHGHIYEAIATLTGTGDPVDAVTVASELERAGLLKAAGGGEALFALVKDVPATSNAARYVRDIEDCALLRRLIAAGGEVAELGYDGRADARNAIDQAEARVFELAQRRTTDTTVHFPDLIGPGLDRLEALYEQGNAITGLRTGFADLDELLSGMQPSALYVLGARPSVGKTALALNIAAHVTLEDKAPTMVFSLEMSRDELFQRIFCAEARVDSKKVRNGQLTERDWQMIAGVTSRFADVPLWIDDNPNLTIMELRAKARRMQAKVGQLGLVVVDYLQLMGGRSSAENRQVEIAEISRGLKILARELRCPVLALSQLSRALESRADRRPVLADLRESGSLEQDADVVIFAYRDEIYNADSPDRGTAEIIVSKQRHGPTGMVRLSFQGAHTRFASLARGAA